MKTNLKKLVPVLAAALVLAMPAAYAGGGHGTCGHCSKGGGYDQGDLKSKFFMKAYYILKNAEELGLSEQQQADIKNLKYDVKKDMIQRYADIEVVAIDIKRLLMEKQINTEQVNTLIDQKYELKKEKAKALVAAMATLKQTLSDEQYEQLKALKSGKHHRMEKKEKD